MHKGTYHPRYIPVQGHLCSKHPLYQKWASMFQRCEYPKASNYSNYGARGISVCKRWHDFKLFAHDMGMPPSIKHTIDRINNDGNYCKSNCRWASRSDQCINRRKFKNNSSGRTGVVKHGVSWQAKFDYEAKRYIIGYFSTKVDAIAARDKFERLFFKNRDAAIATIRTDAARVTSSTGIRGVSPHVDGGYTVRVTVDGKRKYLGYFKTLKDACDARDRKTEN